MKFFAVALFLGLSVGSSAMADRRIVMKVGTEEPASSTSCSLTFFSKGWMNFSKELERGGTVIKSTGSVDLPKDRVQQFEAAAQAILESSLPEVETKSGATPSGYVRLEYLEGEQGEFTLEHLAIRPGADVPPVLMALFAPIEDGVCLGRQE
jgi:hypothetical protein